MLRPRPEVAHKDWFDVFFLRVLITHTVFTL